MFAPAPSRRERTHLSAGRTPNRDGRYLYNARKRPLGPEFNPRRPAAAFSRVYATVQLQRGRRAAMQFPPKDAHPGIPVCRTKAASPRGRLCLRVKTCSPFASSAQYRAPRRHGAKYRCDHNRRVSRDASSRLHPRILRSAIECSPFHLEAMVTAVSIGSI